jgi:hypothetical protein
MEHPKMAVTQYVYSRPEPSGAVGQVMDEYLRIKTTELGSPELATEAVEREVALTCKDFLKLRKEEREGKV